MLTTPHPKILRAQETHLSELEMANVLQELRRAVETHDTEAASLIADRWVEHEGKSVRDKTATEGSLGAG